MAIPVGAWKSVPSIAVTFRSEASYRRSDPFVGLDKSQCSFGCDVGNSVGVAVGLVTVGSIVGTLVGVGEGEGVGAVVQAAMPILGLGASPLRGKLALECC